MVLFYNLEHIESRFQFCRFLLRDRFLHHPVADDGTVPEGVLDHETDASFSRDDLIDLASEVLGRDIAACYAGDCGFETNRSVQVGVFVCNHLHMRALQAQGIDAELSLGLSLGEYNHLVHIGALSFEEALRLVDARGEAYDAGPEGIMAAVYPVTMDELEPILVKAGQVGFVAVSNANGPGQQVIAGERHAVEEAMRLLDEELFAMGTVIEDRIPMHTERFKPVVDVFGPALQAADWQVPTKPYLPNTRATLLPGADRDTLIECLSEHVHKPVRFMESIDTIRARHADAFFIEVGPKTVLHDLLRKSWIGQTPRHHTASPDAFASVLDAHRGAA